MVDDRSESREAYLTERCKLLEARVAELGYGIRKHRKSSYAFRAVTRVDDALWRLID